jgi:hypothetical protein
MTPGEKNWAIIAETVNRGAALTISRSDMVQGRYGVLLVLVWPKGEKTLRSSGSDLGEALEELIRRLALEMANSIDRIAAPKAEVQ